MPRLLDLKARYPDDPDIDALFRDAFGYPDDLPDLAALRPPGGNARPGGVAASAFALRVAGLRRTCLEAAGTDVEERPAAG